MGTTGDVTRVWCEVCGTFVISGSARAALAEGEWREERFVLAGRLIQASESKAPLRLTTDNIPTLIAQAPIPPVSELPDRLLLRLANLAPSLFGRIELPLAEYARFYLRSPDELNPLLGELRRFDYLEWEDGGQTAHHCKLRLEGWRRVEALKKTMPDSAQAFVAMWFSVELEDAWNEGFYPALCGAGYTPFRVDKKEHSGKIDDLIISEIRRSGLLVADFTGHRGGVYFEAGFALGLNLPVIWTCRTGAEHELHFDTRQYNHILWENPTDLKEKLVNRIGAVAPRART